MAFWLADKRNDQDADWIQRFDPRFWTVNFPRPMMAALTCPGPDVLRADVTFLREGDLAGVIWDSKDELDHPLLRYETDHDYSRTRLSFRWRSDGVLPLDAVNGPTLTIEGEDEAGNARTWYVRLWNYAQGTASDARIVLNFSDLAGGFLLPEEAQPVSPHKIARMFISLVAPGFVPGSTAPLAAPGNGWAELSEIRCEGHRCLLKIGDVIVPPHGLAIATAYDDCTNQTPERLIRNPIHSSPPPKAIANALPIAAWPMSSSRTLPSAISAIAFPRCLSKCSRTLGSFRLRACLRTWFPTAPAAMSCLGLQGFLSKVQWLKRWRHLIRSCPSPSMPTETNSHSVSPQSDAVRQSCYPKRQPRMMWEISGEHQALPSTAKALAMRRCGYCGITTSTAISSPAPSGQVARQAPANQVQWTCQPACFPMMPESSSSKPPNDPIGANKPSPGALLNLTPAFALGRR